LRGGAETGHADADGAVLADDGDGLVDAGPVGRVQAGDVAFDAADELPDDGDLLVGGCCLVACPGVDAGGGGEPFAGAEQIIEVGGQVRGGRTRRCLSRQKPCPVLLLSLARAERMLARTAWLFSSCVSNPGVCHCDASH